MVEVTFLFFESVRSGALRCGHCEKMTRMSKDYTWLPAFIKQPGYIGQKGMANAEPYEFVELFLHESFWELLTVETNRYMALNKVLCKAQEKQLQALDDVTMPEIKKFFAIYFAMGIVPQCNLRDYWQAKNVITQIPAFLQVISKNYLCAIWTHLHFSYNTKAVPGGAYGYDRLFKIRQLIDTANFAPITRQPRSSPMMK